MIKTIDMSGKTEDAAINAALEKLGLDRDDVSVEILERAKSGFLGIGACPAVVRVSYEAPDEKPEAPAAKAKKPEAAKPQAKPEQPKQQKEKKAEKPVEKAQPKHVAPKQPIEGESAEQAEIRAFLDGLMSRMGVDADIEISEDKDGISVNLCGAGIGSVIGRRGETLDAIQHLTNYVINKGNEKHTRINVDAENYRSRREESLTKLAEKMAEKVIKYKRSMALEPMNSYERHVIHTALQNYEGVTTSSTGTEPNRRVVVSYVKPENTSKKPQSREWA